MSFLPQILKDLLMLDVKPGPMAFAQNALSIGLLMLIESANKLMEFVRPIKA